MASGEAAIQAAGLERPDAILMDIRLAGEMDGIEAAREIIARYKLPIIFMTGYSDPQVMARAKALQPVAYLLKPVTGAQLEAILADLFPS